MSASQSQYEADFYQWSLEQARLLLSGDWTAVDVEHLAEEIEYTGKVLEGGRKKFPQNYGFSHYQMEKSNRNERHKLAIEHLGTQRLNSGAAGRQSKFKESVSLPT